MKKFILSLLFCLCQVAVYAQALPQNLKWLTNDKDAIFSSSEAKQGGNFKTYIDSFPLTLREFGPDSNGSFSPFIEGNRMALTDLHPNSSNPIPCLATHWAYGTDNKSIFYKLDRNAKWSDGTPVTADDYLFALELLRSNVISDIWNNNYYQKTYDKIVKYDPYTIGIFGKRKYSRKELHLYYNLKPSPKHFYKLDKEWVKNYNWKVAPNTGPYLIDSIEKGKSLTLKRKKDWWGDKLRYYAGRFNPEKITVTVIKDLPSAYEGFLKGEIDHFPITVPEYWHEKAKGALYDNGFIHKIWFYVEQPQADMGIFLNTKMKPLDDINVRLGLQHAMNIDKVIKTLLRNDYERLQHFSSGYGVYSNNTLKARSYDLKLADEYFVKAGWKIQDTEGIRKKNGERLSLEILYMAPHHTDRLLILKDEAKKAGVELKLKLLDGASGFTTLMEKQHQLALLSWSTALVPQYWEYWHSANANRTQTNNVCNYANSKMDKLIEAFDNEADEGKKVKYAQDIQKLIHDEAPFIPSFAIPYFRDAYWRYWKFPRIPATKMSTSVFDLFGPSGGLFWLDQKSKDETDKAKKSKGKFVPVSLIDKNFKG